MSTCSSERSCHFVITLRIATLTAGSWNCTGAFRNAVSKQLAGTCRRGCEHDGMNVSIRRFCLNTSLAPCHPGEKFRAELIPTRRRGLKLRSLVVNGVPEQSPGLLFKGGASGDVASFSAPVGETTERADEPRSHNQVTICGKPTMLCRSMQMTRTSYTLVHCEISSRPGV